MSVPHSSKTTRGKLMEEPRMWHGAWTASLGPVSDFCTYESSQEFVKHADMIWAKEQAPFGKSGDPVWETPATGLARLPLAPPAGRLGYRNTQERNGFGIWTPSGISWDYNQRPGSNCSSSDLCSRSVVLNFRGPQNHLEVLLKQRWLGPHPKGLCWQVLR